MLHLRQGNWSKARPIIEHAIEVLRAGNVMLLFLLPVAVANSAWVLAQLGDVDGAVNRLREGEKLVERLVPSGMIANSGATYVSLGRARLLLGQFDAARSLGDRAIDLSPGSFGSLVHALHLLGDIAAQPDRFDAESGETYYRKALALAESRGMRPLVAHCHLGLGKLLWRTAKREQAREYLTTATMMYRAMDMPFWLEQAETETCQLG
jgi:tetratricopeptide (TPR) repeat protein